MRILICSDGTDPADKPTRLGGALAASCQAETTLLGIAERPEDDGPLRAALESEAQWLRGHGVTPKIVVRSGEPIHQILSQTAETKYDFVIIGARRKGSSGLYWYSERTYEVIKAVPAPVLVARGECEKIERILVCTGGKHYSEGAVQLSGEVAKCLGASVTLLHVMAEPPAIYAHLVRLEEDVNQLLESSSELGRNLRGQKGRLEKLGLSARVRVRHGIAIDEIFNEVEEGGYGMIVTGSSPARGTLRHYIMGDLARTILNQSRCPVLVARLGAEFAPPGVWGSIRRIFAGAR